MCVMSLTNIYVHTHKYTQMYNANVKMDQFIVC